MIVNKKKIIIGLLSIVGFILVIIGTTYAFFNYTKTGGSNLLSTGDIAFSATGDTLLDVSNDFPQYEDMSNEELTALKSTHNGSLSVSGHNTLQNGVKYSIYVVRGDDIANKQRLDDSSIKFQLEPDFTSGSNGFTVLTNNYSEPTNLVFDNDGKALISTGLVKNTSSLTTVDYNYYMWLDASSMLISSTTKRETLAEGNPSLADTTSGNTTSSRYLKNDGVLTNNVTLFPASSNDSGKIVYTTNEFSNGYYNIRILVEAEEGKQPGYEKVLAKIEEKENQGGSCSNITYEEEGITYLSGTNDCIDMNYVWYSGKLWRITAIYPDGAMKLVTEDSMTAILWGSTIEYDGSWIYQWLNEDFYDTLYNTNDILESNSTWNYSTAGNGALVRPETIETQKTKVAPVGLLNAYEYDNSCRNTGSDSNGFLKTGYSWWLITPYSTSAVRAVSDYGYIMNGNNPKSVPIGVRPSIIIKSDLEFSGNGTKQSPYKILVDKRAAVYNTTLLNSRSVGEYVKFDNDIYRIVDVTDGITKLTKVDYLRNSGTVITKNFASSSYYGKSGNTESDTYWDYYLNNSWYNSISSTYKNMLVDGTYYLGFYPNNNTNYKATICKDATLDSVTTKTCTKYTSNDADKTFTGKVGLPRVGEMFSSQLGNGSSTSSNIWMITPYSASYVRDVDSTGGLNGFSPASDMFTVRPSITLKSGIKITGGTGYVGGDTNSPFEISE